MNINRQRKKNIDFLRFLFAFLIVMFHFRKICGIEVAKDVFRGIDHYNICVEFFFVMAGYFLFSRIDTRADTFEFIKHKFLRLAPLIWIFVILSAISSLIFNFDFSFSGNILRLFLSDCLGFAPGTGGASCIATWFVSVLFYVSVFYFYIAKIFDKKYLNLIIWLVTVGSLGIYLNNNNYGFGGHINNIALLFNTGILRGLYGTGIGYFINMLKEKNFLVSYTSPLAIRMFGLSEILLSSVLIYYFIFTNKVPGRSSFVIVCLFAALFYMFLIGKGVLSKLLNNDISVLLGQSSYAIYLMHGLLGDIVEYVLKHDINLVMLYPHRIYLAEVFAAIVFGIFSHYIFEKPVTGLIKKYIPADYRR